MDTKMPGSSRTMDALAGGGEMGQLMRQTDWSATPVGPVASWPQSLLTAASICLNSRFPIILFWGPSLVQFYNDAYRPIIGEKHPRAMGQPASECFPEIWDIIGPMLNGVLGSGEATWVEDLYLPLVRSGYAEECYFTFSYSPIRIEGGAPGGVFTAVTETTRKVLGERRLQTLHHLAEATARSQSVEQVCDLSAATLETNTADLPFTLLYLLDSDGSHAQLACSTGYAAQKTLGPAEATLAKPDPDDIWPLAQVIQSKQAVLVTNLPERLHLPEGQHMPASAIVLPVTQAGQDQVSGLLVAGINPMRQLDEEYRNFFGLIAGQIAAAITNARAHEAERQRAEALAEIDRQKTAFFSNVSHEFRTPLTLLLGPVEDALRVAEDHQQRERLEIIQRNALRLLKLVNTLLDFSRIEAGRIEAVYQPVELATYTAELASTFRSAIERAGLQYVVDCPPLSEPVYVDLDMWEKIVLNLLSNAFKFTFTGTISVTLRRNGQRVELTVTDTGRGIAAEEQPNLFTRFHRVRGAEARTHEGTGIGLALVQELAHLHGGNVTVTSAPGKGSSFTVSIPTGTAHLPAERIGSARTLESTVLGTTSYLAEAIRWGARQSEQDAEQKRTGGETNSSGTARILLADDNADMREYLTRLLEPNYTVTAVADGKAAFEAAQAEVPDLIISDIMMPGMDGIQLVHALRHNSLTQRVPVIFLSARAGQEAAVEGLYAGADDYLVKPFAAQELLARVRTSLELGRMREEAVRSQQELNNLRDTFISVAIHELRNPLTAIKGMAQYVEHRLRRQQGNATSLHSLEIMLQQIELMDGMISQLHDLSRIQSGQLEIQPVPCTNLIAFVERVVERYRLTTSNYLFCTIHNDEILTCSFDETHLEQVLNNLITNAMKYSPQETTICVGVERRANEAVIWVQDEGIGIAVEDQAHLFERFYRAHTLQRGKVAGLGLGLYISHEIIKQHGGRIWVESNPGKGSKFYIALPL